MRWSELKQSWLSHMHACTTEAAETLQITPLDDDRRNVKKHRSAHGGLLSLIKNGTSQDLMYVFALLVLLAFHSLRFEDTKGMFFVLQNGKSSCPDCYDPSFLPEDCEVSQVRLSLLHLELALSMHVDCSFLVVGVVLFVPNVIHTIVIHLLGRLGMEPRFGLSY